MERYQIIGINGKISNKRDKWKDIKKRDKWKDIK